MATNANLALTRAQRVWLERLLAHGHALRAPYHDNFRSFERTMGRLVEMGYATPYVHGGWEITEAGARAAGSKQTVGGKFAHIEASSLDALRAALGKERSDG